VHAARNIHSPRVTSDLAPHSHLVRRLPKQRLQISVEERRRFRQGVRRNCVIKKNLAISPLPDDICREIPGNVIITQEMRNGGEGPPPVSTSKLRPNMEQPTNAQAKIKTAGICCQPFVPQLARADLSASAATVKSTPTVEAASTTNCGAVEPSTDRSMHCRSATIEAASAIVAATVAPACSSVEAAPVVATSPTISVVPGTGADEDAVREPVRPIVSVRRARVRRVIIVAIRTSGWSADISGAKSHAHTHSNLRLRLDQRKRHQHTQQQKIFKVAHCSSPFFPDSPLAFRERTRAESEALRCFLFLSKRLHI